MKTRTYLAVTASILALVALVHLVRMVQGWLIQVGTTAMPMWASALTVLVAGAVAVWGFTLIRRQT